MHGPLTLYNCQQGNIVTFIRPLSLLKIVYIMKVAILFSCASVKIIEDKDNQIVKLSDKFIKLFKVLVIINIFTLLVTTRSSKIYLDNLSRVILVIGVILLKYNNTTIRLNESFV